MRSTRLGILALCVVLALAGCTSSGSPKKAQSSSSPAGDVTGKLESGVASLTSAHLTASTDYAGQTIKGSGVVQLKGGRIVGGDVTQALPGGLGDIHIIETGGKTYAKLPAGLANTAKPWLLVTAGSSNPLVAQLSTLIGTVLGIAAPSSLTAFATAATAVEDKGSATVNGVQATHYALTVDPKKLSDTLRNSVGTATTLPVDLYLDAQGRPVQVSGTFTLLGQKITPTIQLSAFNQPVTVTAPPAAQVGAS